MDAATRLRNLLAEPGLVVLPGIYDCLSARLAEQAGFEALFTSGFGISASLLGKPDYGFLTATETLQAVERITRAVSVPVIADLDTGYGNALNTYHTVEQAVAAGVAGIILEDQVWPKRCGHFSGKQVISRQAQVEKLRAARAAAGPGLVIVGRTDARAVEGLDSAIARGRAYREAGADIIFVEAPESIEELEKVARAFPDTPTLANMIPGGRTPLRSADELEKIGFKISVFALTGLFAAVAAMQEAFTRLRREGAHSKSDLPVDFSDFERLIGVSKYRDLQNRFSSEEDPES